MLIALLVLHVVLFHIDEHFFNKKREHSKYEIMNITSDGVFFILPQLLAIFVTYDEKWVLLYKSLAGISMISIVMNEIFYKNLPEKERLLHACLYVLHPIILFTFYESWRNNYFQTHPNFWMVQLIYVGIGFKTICYQIVYWNYIHKK